MSLDYYFSLSSPWTYLGNERIQKLANKKNLKINYKPVDVSIIFPQTGGLPLAQRAPERQLYRLQELKRWSEYLELPINLNPKFFPAKEWPAAGLVIEKQLRGSNPGPIVNSFLQAVWVKEQDISKPETIIKIAIKNGLGDINLSDKVLENKLKSVWAQNSHDGIAAGVFGVPTYKMGGELFWGQDRLDFLERSLTQI